LVLQLIKYPHPTLRHKSKPLCRVDAELRAMIHEMFDVMYAMRESDWRPIRSICPTGCW
jgi:peptide deformylase